MNEVKIEELPPSLPGEYTCAFVKLIAWLIVMVSLFFGSGVVKAFLQGLVNSGNDAAIINTNDLLVASVGIIIATLFFVLVNICENLIKMNQRV